MTYNNLLQNNVLKIQLLYGSEFWDKLEELIKNAKERVFLISAYIGEPTYCKIKNLISDNVFDLALCRNDSPYKPNGAIVANKNNFHGKLYLIDNDVIIGSQNLYEPQVIREGEFSILMKTNKYTSSLIVYQAMLKIIENEYISAEPIDKSFLEFYKNGCPFCGNNPIPDPYSVYRCPEYGNNENFVSEEDCSSYGDEGACKYCLPERREPLGECYCCDDSGCGFVIRLDNGSLIYHAINPLSRDNIQKARDFLRLFNYILNNAGERNAIETFYKLDFIGKVYEIISDRPEQTFINLRDLKKIMDDAT